jgi:hypothetical protein
MKHLSVPVLIIVLISIPLLGCSRDEESSAGEGKEVLKDGRKQVSFADVTLQWKVIESEIEITLSAPTKGWVAIGFHPSEMMQDANFIIGYVKDETPVVRDDFGTWFSSHESDEELGGTNDVTLLSGTEIGNETSLSFRLPLDSGDENDQVIVPGEETPVLLAFGTKDSLSSMHRKKAKKTVVF